MLEIIRLTAYNYIAEIKERVNGVVKFSCLWLIPKDAEKPADARMKAGRTKKHE